MDQVAKTYYDPVTGQPVSQPLQQGPKTYYDPVTGQPASGKPTPAPSVPQVSLPPDFGSDTFKAAVHAQMLDIDPGEAYRNRVEIDKQLRAQGGDYDQELEPGMMNDIVQGWRSSIFGMHSREKLPDEMRKAGLIDRAVTGLTEFVADSPFYAAGALIGGIGGGIAGSEVPVIGNITVGALGTGAGAFAVPAAVREALVIGIKNGEVKGFGDLMRRAASVTWAATKGALTGAATELSGGLPVPGMLAKSGVASIATKGMYQVAAMTTAGDLLEGRMPTASEFTTNAALMIPLNLITHGLTMKSGEAKQAAMDRYVADGTRPSEQTEQLNAQPPVKPDLPEGLRPAIQTAEGFVDGDTTEDHAALAERTFSKKPLSMAELEADPAKADDVLQNPKIHEQDVIDRAWQLKSEAVDAGDVEGLSAPEQIAQDQPRQAINDFMTRVGTRMAREQYAQGILDDMEYAGESPRAISDKFWNETYFDMPAEAQQAMQKQLKALTGMQPGDVIMVKADGTTVEAKDWADIAHNLVGDSVEYLEGGERGYVAMMRDASDRFGPNAKTQPEPPPRTSSKGELPAPKPLSINDLYNRAEMKSGRGFVTPDGKFLSRMEARNWMKENEPEVHAMWADGVTGEKAEELHSQDYAEARQRTQALNVVKGDPMVDAMPPDLRNFLAEARSKTGILNKVKADLASKGYGYEAIRTLLIGPRNFLRANGEQIVGGLRKLLPDAVDQEALHFFRDYRGDLPQLQSDIEEIRSGENEKLKAYLPAMERAAGMNGVLPEKFAQADAMMTDYFTKALALGRQVGVLDSAVDPSRYSPRMFQRAMEDSQQAGFGRSNFTDRTVNSIRRDYLHTLDPLKAGDVEARTFNAVDELSIYNDRFATSVSTAIFKAELKNSALGIEGARAKVPANWVPLSNEFEDRRTIQNEDGSTVTTVRNLYVPKDIAAALKPLLEAPGQLSQLTKFLHIQSVIKGIELTLSAFHVKALTVTAFNNLGLKQFATAMLADINAPDTLAIEQRGALYGLTTTKTGIPVESYMSLKAPEAATGFARLKDNAAVKAVDGVGEAISKFTFDTVQRKWKVMDYAKKESAWIAKHPDANPSEFAAAMRGYAKEINAAYGGLNWDVMGVSKGTQNVARMILLAPDWTFSNVANLKYAFTDGGTAGSASRAFFLKSFMTGFAATAAASIYFGGKYDPTDVKHMDQVYLGTDKDGKDMYANWFFAGAPKDAMNLVKRTASDGPLAGPAQIILSKASPIAGTVVDLAENKDFKGSPIYKRTDDTASQALDQGKYAAEKLLPITGVSALQTVINAMTDPTHDWSYKDLISLAADALGSPTVHSGGGTKTSINPNKSAAPKTSNKFTIKGRK